MGDPSLPEPPAEWSRVVDYHAELTMARLSRASYLTVRQIHSEDVSVNPDYPHLFSPRSTESWKFADQKLASDDAVDRMPYVFENAFSQKIVIAIRGNDSFEDWNGPTDAVARDGELLKLMGMPSPETDRTKRQMAALQDALLPGEAWDPQFAQVLDFAKAVRDEYEPLGYEITVTGHGMGGAHAQVIAHTFGWGGRSFDAPGAANIVESEGYRKWLADNQVTLPDTSLKEVLHLPWRSEDFLNYKVNNSAVSQMMGPHLGEKQSISSYVGREGLASQASYAAGLVAGAYNETPLLSDALSTRIPGAMAGRLDAAAQVGQYGTDAFYRHDIDRIVRVFETAAVRQDQGDRQPLPMFGADPENAEHPFARNSTRPSPLDALSVVAEPLPHVTPDASYDAAMKRFLEAASGDATTFRGAARELCDTPQAKAWLEMGIARADAQQTVARDMLMPCPDQQHAQAPAESAAGKGEAR